MSNHFILLLIFYVNMIVARTTCVQEQEDNVFGKGETDGISGNYNYKEPHVAALFDPEIG